ncbi:MAG: hypothetical protein N3I35_18630 [Clostridia bacterium]|nr:hypothetical protein [Clostridia bacterium]
MNVKKEIVKRNFNATIYGEKAINKLLSFPRSKMGKYLTSLIEKDINSTSLESKKNEIIDLIKKL